MEQLKKYKLQDLVANGSYARRKINSDLLVGDTSAGYGYGDILDANATAQLVEKKLEDLSGDDINQAVIDELMQKDTVHDNRLAAIENAVTTVTKSNDSKTATVNGDELVISL